jgi:hypothetical protein
MPSLPHLTWLSFMKLCTCRFLIIGLILAALQPYTVVSAFSIPATHVATRRALTRKGLATPVLYPTRTNGLALAAKQSSNDDLDGTIRGAYLLALVGFFVIWSFSIPVEFRRAHWCFTTTCEQNRSLPFCHDCVTFGEWSHDIVEYYRNGGGVQWDFSVGEETKEMFGM